MGSTCNAAAKLVAPLSPNMHWCRPRCSSFLPPKGWRIDLQVFKVDEAQAMC